MGDRKKLNKKAKRVKMVLLDVDGVLTDGGIYYSADGVEMKRFNAQDGYGIARAHERGLKIGIVSGRNTPIVDARARELKVVDLYQNASDKVAVLRKIQEQYGLDESAFAYMGDDLFDLPLLSVVGFSGAPRNARSEVKKQVDFVTRAIGGEGAAREFIDFILQCSEKETRNSV